MRGNNVLALRHFFLLSWLALYVLSIDSGKLGIVWNKQLATEPTANPRQKHAWLSIAEFDKNVVDIFSDEEIAGLAKLAHEDMMKEFKSDNPPWRDPRNNIPARQLKKAPVAMTLIVSGKRIYAASSVRGGGIAYTPYATAKVREALIQCQMETAGHTPHRTIAGCGEPMAAHLAFESGLTSLNGAKVCENRIVYDGQFFLTPLGYHIWSAGG